MNITKEQVSQGFADLHKIAHDKGDFATNGAISPEAFKAQWDDTLLFCREKLAQLETTTDKPTRENLLIPLDDIARHLANKRGICWTFETVHPDASMRQVIEQVAQELDKISIEINQSSRLAYIMEDLDNEPLDELDKRFVAHWKRDFRRAGCFLSPDPRVQVKQLQVREAELGRKYDRNLIDGQRSMLVKPAQLKGLSDEFMRTHPVREDGMIELKTTYADRMSVMEFCDDDSIRESLWFLCKQVATPENAPLLKELVEVRFRLAKLLGYRNYAAYSLETEMIASPENAYNLIQELQVGTAKKLQEEKAELQDALGITEPLKQWQVYYAKNLVAKKKLGGFERSTASQFFRTWHETVLVHDVYDADRPENLLGRIYIDHIFRQDKEQHPCAVGMTPGVSGKQFPEGVLIVGLNSQTDATMTFWDAVSCWHELGHVMHQVLAGQGQRYHRFSGTSVEQDFVEAPSQLAENWLKIPEIIKSFATDAKGETISDDLIEKLLKSEEYTKCVELSGRLVLSRLSLVYHELQPEDLEADFNRIWRDADKLYGAFSVIPEEAEYHPELNFPHFCSYGPRYISYQNSLAICNEMLEVWKASPKGLLDATVSQRYRREVLQKGSTLDGKEMVRAFLGRYYTPQGYLKYLNA